MLKKKIPLLDLETNGLFFCFVLSSRLTVTFSLMLNFAMMMTSLVSLGFREYLDFFIFLNIFYLKIN
jgi:hypothetical protein